MAVDTEGTATGSGSAPQGLALLAHEFVDLVEVLYDAETSMLTTDRLVTVATHAVESAEHAAVTVVSDGVLRTEAATSSTASRVDRIAAEVGRGPAFDALHTSSVVIAHDLDADTSWPELGRRVTAETPVRSILACRLYLADRHTAALNLYSSFPHAFDTTDAATATILAAYCSLALLTQLLGDDTVHPDRVRESHREVGIAIGLLMARRGITAEDAYAELRHASTTLNRSLPDIATLISGRD